MITKLLKEDGISFAEKYICKPIKAESLFTSSEIIKSVGFGCSIKDTMNVNVNINTKEFVFNKELYEDTTTDGKVYWYKVKDTDVDIGIWVDTNEELIAVTFEKE